MNYFTVSHWEAEYWNEELEAITREKFAPMVMSCGALAVNFVRTGEHTFTVITSYSDESAAEIAMKKISDIRSEAANTLPVTMTSDVKGSVFVSL